RRRDHHLSAQSTYLQPRGGRQGSEIDSFVLIEPVQTLQRAMHMNGPVPPRLAQQPDHPLRLAKRIGADQMSAFGKLRQRMDQARVLLFIRRMDEDRQAERGLRNKDITWHGLERQAGRVSTPLVIA